MKTVIYNIDRLAGILPEGTLKLEGEAMGHVECRNDAYLIIEDGIITDFGIGWDGGFHNNLSLRTKLSYDVEFRTYTLRLTWQEDLYHWQLGNQQYRVYDTSIMNKILLLELSYRLNGG